MKDFRKLFPKLKRKKYEIIAQERLKLKLQDVMSRNELLYFEY